MASVSKMQRVYRQYINKFNSGKRIKYLKIFLEINRHALIRVWDTSWSCFLSYVGSIFDLQLICGF